MVDAVEHTGLDGGVVAHVLEDYLIANVEWVRESPRLHPVARKTRVATKTIHIVGVGECGWVLALKCLGTTNGRPVRHLKTVGHVAGEADIEDGGLDALVLDYVNNLADEWTCLPSEGRAWFEDDLEVWVAGVELVDGPDEQFHIVVLACHEVATTEVYPLELWKPSAELVLDVGKGAGEHIASALAVAVDMEALDVGREGVGQLVGEDAKA